MSDLISLPQSSNFENNRTTSELITDLFNLTNSKELLDLLNIQEEVDEEKIKKIINELNLFFSDKDNVALKAQAQDLIIKIFESYNIESINEKLFDIKDVFLEMDSIVKNNVENSLSTNYFLILSNHVKARLENYLKVRSNEPMERIYEATGKRLVLALMLTVFLELPFLLVAGDISATSITFGILLAFIAGTVMYSKLPIKLAINIANKFILSTFVAVSFIDLYLNQGGNILSTSVSVEMMTLIGGSFLVDTKYIALAEISFILFGSIIELSSPNLSLLNLLIYIVLNIVTFSSTAVLKRFLIRNQKTLSSTQAELQQQVINESEARTIADKNKLIAEGYAAIILQRLDGLTHGFKTRMGGMAFVSATLNTQLESLMIGLTNTDITIDEIKNSLKEIVEYQQKIHNMLIFTKSTAEISQESSLNVNNVLNVKDIFPEYDLDDIRPLIVSYKVWANNSTINNFIYDDEKNEKHIRVNSIILIETLDNLISNAIKYSKAKSLEIKFSVKLDDEQNILLISVKDDGIGIPTDIQELLFKKNIEPSTESKAIYGSTGRGLLNNYLLIKQIGGSLTCVSSNKGTTFYLKLPIDILDS